MYGKRILLGILVFLSVGAGSTAALAKPLPPSNLTDIFGEFSELEEKFESGNWDEALEELKEVREEFKKIAPQLNEAGSITEVAGKMSLVFDTLEKALTQKNEEKTETLYIALQKMFFKLLDGFDYKVPPALQIVDKYVDEAKEALEEGKIDKVLSEVNEIDEFFEDLEERLRAQNVSEDKLNEFKKGIIDVKRSGKSGDKDGVAAGLRKLDNLTKTFIAAF